MISVKKQVTYTVVLSEEEYTALRLLVDRMKHSEDYFSLEELVPSMNRAIPGDVKYIEGLFDGIEND